MNLENFVNVMGINVIKAIDKIQCVKKGRCRSNDPDDYINKCWWKKRFNKVQVCRASEHAVCTPTELWNKNAQLCLNLFNLNVDKTVNRNGSPDTEKSPNQINIQSMKKATATHPKTNNIWTTTLRRERWCATQTFLSTKINNYSQAVNVVVRNQNDVLIRGEEKGLFEIEDEFFSSCDVDCAIGFLQPLYVIFYQKSLV